jgi:hypothetical protein
MASQIPDPKPGQDKKPAVVEDPLTALIPLLPIPANPPIPRLQGEGGGAKADGADQTALGIDQIADLGAGKRCMTEVVIAINQPIPEQRVCLVLHLVQLDGTQV